MKNLDKSLLKSNIEKIAGYDISENNLFGSAYIVIQNGEVIYKNCFGVTAPDGNTAVTENTLFRLASMTKPVTAIAALILAERGKLSLSDPISKYLPEYKDVHISKFENGAFIDCGKAKKEAVISNLLSHCSGIGSGSSVTVMTAEDKKSVNSTVAFFAKNGLDFEPESMHAYSPFAAFDVLTAIIEKVADEEYPAFLQREILNPCQMTDTTFSPTDSQWKRIITMHNKIDGKNAIGKTYENCVFENFPCSHYLSGAGLVSSLADYSRFAQMLLNKGKTDSKRILTEKTFNLISTPHVNGKIIPSSERWGLGVRVIVDSSYGRLPVGAYGWSGAYGSHFWIDPQNQIAAVFMKNSRFDGGAGNQSACRFENAVNESLI